MRSKNIRGSQKSKRLQRTRREATAVKVFSRSSKIDAETALIRANSYCLFHLPTLYTGGVPHRLSMPQADLWIVPIVLTHPGHGVVGEVGVLAVDARTGEVVGSSSRDEVLATGKRLREEKGDALKAAFRRARTS